SPPRVLRAAATHRQSTVSQLEQQLHRHKTDYSYGTVTRFLTTRRTRSSSPAASRVQLDTQPPLFFLRKLMRDRPQPGLWSGGEFVEVRPGLRQSRNSTIPCLAKKDSLNFLVGLARIRTGVRQVS